jgi:hypothetical protein
VTLDEARSLLGVTPSATAPEIRRAYLRKVKEHSPERDPEGFTRVRAAYESLCDPRIVVVPARPDPAPAAQTNNPRVEDDAEAPAGQEETHPDPEPTPSPDAEQEAANQAAYDDLKRRFAALPAFDNEAKAAFFTREWWDRPCATLYWFTLEKLGPLLDARPTFVQCLRKAADLDYPLALSHLVQAGPELVRDDELARLLDADEVGERLAGARVLVQRGDRVGVMDVAREMIESSAHSDPPVGDLVELALFAVMRQLSDLAEQLRDLIAAHFERFHDERQVLSQEQSVAWSVLRELLVLWRELPTYVLVAAAAYVMAPSPEGAPRVLDVMLYARGERYVLHNHGLLKTHAPVLSGLIGLPAAITETVQPSPFSFLRHLNLHWFILLGLLLTRCLATGGICELTSPVPSHSTFVEGQP